MIAVFVVLMIMVIAGGVVLYYRYYPTCPDCGSRAWEKGWAGWSCKACGTWFERIEHDHFFLHPKQDR